MKQSKAKQIKLISVLQLRCSEINNNSTTISNAYQGHNYLFCYFQIRSDEMINNYIFIFLIYDKTLLFILYRSTDHISAYDI